MAGSHEDGEPPRRPAEPTLELSHRLGVPRPIDPGTPQRTYLEWRGIPLPNPATLDLIPPGRHVPIVRAFCERGVAFVQLAHPETGARADYAVRWIAPGKPELVLLQIGPAWPGPEAHRLVLLDVPDRGTLRTLDPEEFLRGLARVQPDMSGWGSIPFAEVERVFGPLPESNSPEFRAATAADLRGPLRSMSCVQCERPVRAEEDACPACGEPRIAPPCPRCGKPVSRARDARSYFARENGAYRWHSDWNGICVECGFPFVARLELATGHDGGIPAVRQRLESLRNAGKTQQEIDAALQQPLGHSRIEVHGGESVFTYCDDWDHQPTIIVEIERAAEARGGAPGEGLTRKARIEMTPAEWQAVIEQLQGPLRVLLERKPWRRDTT